MLKNQIKTDDKLTKAKLEHDRARDNEKVRGMFKFYEVNGGTLSFVYRAYKNDRIEKYTLVDGQVYEIPLGVAKHLNKNGWYPVHSYKKEESGMKVRVGEKVHRFGFQSLDFIDSSEFDRGKEIITVEHVL